ncbi:MAG: PGPGW domain-containing protein [Bryobacteraceae bacterium]
MIRKGLRIAGGAALVLIGVAGLLLPVMPGWVFLIPGLVILSEYFPPIKRLLNWAKAKATGKSGATGGVGSVNDTPGNG